METIDGIRVSLKNAIGLPYGTLFAIDGNEIEPVREQALRECPFSTSDIEKESLISNDNRDIVDSKCNQKLDYEDIKLLRFGGTAGKEIMTELVKGNTNFNKKTVFSQEKYLCKKRKRHLGLFTIDRPCTRVLCELYSKLRRDKCL
ncbi:unnamed protein product [Dicrocoelium dendriticum]|nr:unnamed protein product [Dicrocoelium dendriticum]